MKSCILWMERMLQRVVMDQCVWRKGEKKR